MKARWGDTEAQVVWLYVAYTLEDIQVVNWVCRSAWIDANLPKGKSPGGLGEKAETYKGIEILWNDKYEVQKSWYENSRGDKASVVEKHRYLIEEVKRLAGQVIGDFELFQSGQISENKFVTCVQNMIPEIDKVYRTSESTVCVKSFATTF